jgi:ABC-type uncharacterized transport system fused permease/ATPase subunit
MFLLNIVILLLLTLLESLTITLYVQYVPKKIFNIKKKMYDLQYLKDSAYYNKQDEIEKDIENFVVTTLSIFMSIVLLILMFIKMFLI